MNWRLWIAALSCAFTIRNFLFALLLVLLCLAPESFRPSPAVEVGLARRFSVLQWEVVNVPAKWMNLAYGLLRGRRLDRAQRLEVVDEYMEATRLARRQERMLEGLAARSGALSPGSGGRERVEAARAHLRQLASSRDKLRPLAEEIVEAELDGLLSDAGFGSRFGLLFPPVDLRFEDPPTVLNTSRRDHIEVVEQALLAPRLPALERDRIERELLDKYDYSALVDDLAGLSTYPTFVSDQAPLRSVLRTAAHEWLHAYLFFRPLGWNWRRSPEMFSLNETVAELAGNELGDALFARMGGDLTIGASRYAPRHERDSFFTAEMRETRRQVDALLEDGMVEEAEEYMKERWWRLRLGGYWLRKLNQAYFAFRGRYAEGPASVSPIGPQVRAMRDAHRDTASFVKTVERVSTYREFLDLLERMGVRAPSTDEPSGG